MMHARAVVCCLALLFAGCQTRTPEDLYAGAQSAHQEAQHALDSIGRTADAKALFASTLEAYERVIDDHPASVQAEQALMKIAELEAGVCQDVPRAIEAYKRFARVYPASAKAPTALFMVGYLYNNYLANIDSAAAAYRLFLQLYPTHELATSAQFELENVGKDPQELLPAEPPKAAAGADRTPSGKR